MIERKMRRQNKNAPIFTFPESVDDCGHQAENPAGALKFHQSGPVLIQTFKYFGMNGKRSFDFTFIVCFLAFRWELLMIVTVELTKCFGDQITRLVVIAG